MIISIENINQLMDCLIIPSASLRRANACDDGCEKALEALIISLNEIHGTCVVLISANRYIINTMAIKQSNPMHGVGLQLPTASTCVALLGWMIATYLDTKLLGPQSLGKSIVLEMADKVQHYIGMVANVSQHHRRMTRHNAIDCLEDRSLTSSERLVIGRGRELLSVRHYDIGQVSDEIRCRRCE
jgi:hypothetical protein